VADSPNRGLVGTRMAGPVDPRVSELLTLRRRPLNAMELDETQHLGAGQRSIGAGRSRTASRTSRAAAR